MHILYNDNRNGIVAGYEAKEGMHFHFFEPEDRTNYESVASIFNLTCKNMVRIQQKHTDKVLVVGNENGGDGVVRAGVEEWYDAIITDVKNLMLCVVTADCVPVFLYDEIRGVIGIAHSGRAGTMSEIAAKTVLRMKEEYGSKPEDIHAILGPYLCMEHHEVNEKDILGFFETFSADEREMFLLKKGEKYYVDMGEAIRISLIRSGVLGQNIIDDRVCTFENEFFPSWRRTHDPDGRALSFILMK